MRIIRIPKFVDGYLKYRWKVYRYDHKLVFCKCIVRRHWFFICRRCNVHSQCWKRKRYAIQMGEVHYEWCLKQNR